MKLLIFSSNFSKMSERMKDVEDSDNPTFSTNCRELKKIQVQKVLPTCSTVRNINCKSFINQAM